MTKDQRIAKSIICNTNHNLFITGPAGTGKTQFVKTTLSAINLNYVVLAPTGIAALNAEGQTINSFFRMDYAPFLPTADNKNIAQPLLRSQFKVNLIRALDAIVIDEVSMVRADVIDKIDAILRQIRNSDSPFGGVRVILLGDLYQLPPIISDSHKEVLSVVYPSLYFFDSKALSQTGFDLVNFKRIYRQTESNFKRLLKRMRVGRMTSEDYAVLNSHYSPELTDEQKKSYIQIVSTNALAKNLNDKMLESISHPVIKYNAHVSGQFPKDSYPNDEVLELKEEARVMLIKNDPYGCFVNGSMGTVVSLKEDSVVVHLDDADNDVDVHYCSWDNLEYKYNDVEKKIEREVTGTFEQLPIKVAWAITSHKCQGLTFDKAAINIPHSFCSGQSYVAFSRCRSIDNMILLNKINVRSFIVDKEADKFYSSHVEVKELAPDNQVGHKSTTETQEESTLVPLGAGEIVKKLKDWRTMEAQKQGIPAYCIIWNSAIEDISRIRPNSIEDLSCIPHVSESFISKYGDTVLDLICEKKSTVAVKEQTAKRPKYELYLDQFNSGLSIEEIADEMGVQVETVYTNLFKCASHGLLDVYSFISQDEIDYVNTFLDMNPHLLSAPISQIRESMNNEVSYALLKYVVAMRQQ